MFGVVVLLVVAVASAQTNESASQLFDGPLRKLVQEDGLAHSHVGVVSQTKKKTKKNKQKREEHSSFLCL